MSHDALRDQLADLADLMPADHDRLPEVRRRARRRRHARVAGSTAAVLVATLVTGALVATHPSRQAATVAAGQPAKPAAGAAAGTANGPRRDCTFAAATAAGPAAAATGPSVLQGEAGVAGVAPTGGTASFTMKATGTVVATGDGTVTIHLGVPAPGGEKGVTTAGTGSGLVAGDAATVPAPPQQVVGTITAGTTLVDKGVSVEHLTPLVGDLVGFAGSGATADTLDLAYLEVLAPDTPTAPDTAQSSTKASSTIDKPGLPAGAIDTAIAGGTSGEVAKGLATVQAVSPSSVRLAMQLGPLDGQVVDVSTPVDFTVSTVPCADVVHAGATVDVLVAKQADGTYRLVTIGGGA